MTILAHACYNVGMYIRTTARRNRDGTVARYVQLAHNYRDPADGKCKARILYNFGREEEVDKEALRRLARSIARFLGPEDELELRPELDGRHGIRFLSSRPMGGAYLLDQLWTKLGIGEAVSSLLKKRRFDAPVERALFAMVASRALAPMSKLAVEDWVSREVFIPGLSEVAVQHLYRAMDFLLESREAIEREVFYRVADLLNLEVDLLYFDTTSTYFETEQEDGFRRRGHSKDHRPDLPQIVVGFAVTREGIPVRSWCWPGNTADMSVVSQVKRDLIGWKLGRVITVLDRGFASEDNLRCLQRAGGHYIVGEKMRGSERAEKAMARHGRYKKVKENLEVKEIVVGDGEARVRYVLVHNPEEAKRDKLRREQILKDLREALAQLKGSEHTKRCCELASHPLYGRYLRILKDGRLKINMEVVREDEKLDGKFLVRTSDDTLSPEDIALGYKQLVEVEDAFRCLKHTLDLRPIYHRLEDRIRSHVLLCWLALLLIRVTENKAGGTWPAVKRTLEAMHLGEFAGPGGRILQRTETTAAQRHILQSLNVKEPPLILLAEPKTCQM